MKLPSKMILAVLILGSFTFAVAASAEEFTWGDRAGQCAGGAAVVGVLVGAPVAAVTYIAEGPRAAAGAAGAISAVGCGITMYGASVERAEAEKAAAEQALNVDAESHAEAPNEEQ